MHNLLDLKATAFWTQVQQGTEGGLVGAQGFHLGMILTKFSLHRFKQVLDPFWLESFKWWKEMNGDRLTVTEDWEPEDVPQVPIAGMHQINIPTATQISSKEAAVQGVTLLHHILWPEALPVAHDHPAMRIAQQGHVAWQRGNIALAPVITDKVQTLLAPSPIQSGIPLSYIKVANTKAEVYITSTDITYFC